MTAEPPASSQPEIENLQAEGLSFPPDPAFAARANATAQLYLDADEDYEAFWARLARSRLTWRKGFRTTLEWDLPFAKWFTGGKLNVSENCLDRHVAAGLGGKVAYHWIGEPGDTRTLTYADMLREVQKTANALKELGVGTGDRVAIYMPMIPELPIAMLACARLGAPHTVIFGGFSAEALSGRINDAQAKLLITADGGWRRGKAVDLKSAADEAVTQSPSIQKVLVVRRVADALPTAMTAGRDVWWHDIVERQSEKCPAVAVDSEHMLYLLYTSGTTAKPKGIMHTTAGYLLGAAYTHQTVFDIKPDDVYWCAADIGWVTGHSYIVYGPLANATTGVIYEGAPDTPAWDRWWQIIEDYKVTILYTAPTAIRAFMKQGEALPAGHDLSSLRLLGSVGEPINPEAWLWYQEHIGGKRCPIVDTWWQTETGMILITPLPGVTATKPGSATFPFPGISADVVDCERPERAPRPGRLPRPQAAVAGHAARHLRRPRPLPGHLLGSLPGHVLRRRRRPARPRRLLLAAGPRRRRDERGRPPHQHHRGGVGAGRPQVGRRGGRGRQERPHQRAGHLRLRDRQGRHRDRRRAGPRAA